MDGHDRTTYAEDGEPTRAPLSVRRKALVVAIASLLLMGQCCCCIIPSGGYLLPLIQRIAPDADFAAARR